MSETKKVTKRDNFNAIIEILNEQGRDDLAVVMEHEIELMNKKVGKPSVNKNAKQNTVLDERVLTVLEDGEARTATQILNLVDISGIEGLEAVSLPRITARLKDLGVKAGKVDKIQEKGKTYFRLGTGVGFPVKEDDTEE